MRNDDIGERAEQWPDIPFSMINYVEEKVSSNNHHRCCCCSFSYSFSFPFTPRALLAFAPETDLKIQITLFSPEPTSPLFSEFSPQFISRVVGDCVSSYLMHAWKSPEELYHNRCVCST